ncbi:DNA-binding protein [Burkholderia ambifaria]|uniref:DNA-binding protein n=1 Tax=Burkholderia ambifaria TaxID=152480 RepID=UPI002B4B9A03|nr:DNA-binding protein [Burkholderia ambifaria]
MPLSRTTINDELKLWKDEQARNDALPAGLPPEVAKAMLSVRTLAIDHGETAFARRSEALEAETASATAQLESAQVANTDLQAEV